MALVQRDKEWLRDGDLGFIGLNSRDNPTTLQQGYVTKSQNFRLDRGVATVRKGLQRKTSNTIAGQRIYGVGTYMDSTGQEVFIIIVGNGIYTYNPQTETFSSKFSFPNGETIDTNIGCDVVVATNKAYILRGHSKRPLVFDLVSTVSVLSTSANTDGHEFPNGSEILYYTNRLIVAGHSHRDATNPYAFSDASRDTICVSNYLDFDHWDETDVFKFNVGANDEITAIAPWTLNEFIVFMRNSIHYVNVGSGKFVAGDGLGSTASMSTLVSDIGCSSQRSVVQANGGIVFLSENGVYFLKPQDVGSNESVRLLTNADPLSKNIDDVIQRINKQYINGSVGIYWNNRYYLAVPLNSEDGTIIATENNSVLVYNFILQSWESVDTYPYTYKQGTFTWGNGASTVYVYAPSHGITTNQIIKISNATGNGINGTYTPTIIDSNNFSFLLSSPASPTIVNSQYTYNNGLITVTSNSHGLTTGTTLNITPTVSSYWTFGNYVITVTGTNTFTFSPVNYTTHTPTTLSYYKVNGTLNYYQGFDVFAFCVAKKDNQRRLFAFDSSDGVFLMEQLNWDEYGEATGTPRLAYRVGSTGTPTDPYYGFNLPTEGVLLSTSSYTPLQIDAQLTTRRYIFETLREKKFSTLECDLYNYSGNSLNTYAIALNTDTNTLIDTYVSGSDNDYTRRNPIRKIGAGIQISFKSLANRCSIKTINVTATPLGKTNKNSK